MDPFEESIVQLVGGVLELKPAAYSVLRDIEGAHSIPQWTSLKHVEMIIALEDRFDLEVPEEAIMTLTNIPTIVKFLRSQDRVV